MYNPTTVIFRCTPLMLITRLLPMVGAQNKTAVECAIKTDTSVEATFDITTWVKRGICIRKNDIGYKCYLTLNDVLRNLLSLRAGEYNGASGVLALLPTIGALLGAPTSEIWKLWTIVPFGGALAMFMSFGGAILPVRVEDYESVEHKGLHHSGSSFRLRRPEETSREGQVADTESLTRSLLDRLDAKLHQEKSVNVAKTDIWLGLSAMVVLLFGAQAAMIVVEQGAILPWLW